MIKLKTNDYNKLVDLIAEHLYIISQTFMYGIDSRVSGKMENILEIVQIFQVHVWDVSMKVILKNRGKKLKNIGIT